MSIPSLSTDQLVAFVELARQGSLRAAAERLHISEQGVRGRLIALESRLGVSLYHKSRGIRTRTPLTAQGQQFLPHATSLIEQCDRLTHLFTDSDEQQQEVHLVASQYLIASSAVETRQSEDRGDWRRFIHPLRTRIDRSSARDGGVSQSWI